MKTNPRGSLRTKIIAWSFVPTAIILTAFAWMAYSSTQKGIGDQAMIEDQELVAQKSTQVNYAIGDLANPPLQSIVLEIDTDHAAPIEERARKILEETPFLDIFDAGIFFTDQGGKVIMSWPYEEARLGQDWSGSETFAFVQRYAGRAVFTNIGPLGPHGEQAACFGLSLDNPDRQSVGTGYYCLLMLPDPGTNFNQAMGKAGFGERFYLLDGNQRVAYSSDTSMIGTDLSGEAYIQQVLAEPKAAARVRKGAQDLVLSYAPLSNMPVEMKPVRWTMMREAPWQEVMRPWITYRRQLVGLLMLGLALPVLLAIIGTRRITGPIRELTNAAQQVTDGQLKHHIEVETGDEIETLAGQFNLMSERLDESYSSLEKKVSDRTRDLQVLNSIIATASASLNIGEILRRALDMTVEQMGFEAGAAFKVEPNPDHDHLSLAAQRGFEPLIPIDFIRAYAGRMLGNYYEAQVTSERIEEVAAGKRLVRLLTSVPLSTKGRTLGLFLLSRSQPLHLSPDELSLLESVGRQVGVGMENARLYEQAEQAAIVAERHRLARELHDAVTQTLFSANLIADVIPGIWKRDPQDGLKNLEELRQLTRGALAEMRTLLLEMRPEALERSDIKSLLSQLADAFGGRVRVPVALDIQGDCELAHDVKMVFYRAAQEALNNIAKHSGARQVELHLGCQPGRIHMRIKDDGLGFDAALIAPGHMGIAIMRERAASIGASLQVDSQPGRGTTVELNWESGEG